MLVSEALLLATVRWVWPGVRTVGTVPSDRGSAWMRLLGPGFAPFWPATTVGAGDKAADDGASVCPALAASLDSGLGSSAIYLGTHTVIPLYHTACGLLGQIDGFVVEA